MKIDGKTFCFFNSTANDAKTKKETPLLINIHAIREERKGFLEKIILIFISL